MVAALTASDGGLMAYAVTTAAGWRRPAPLLRIAAGGLLAFLLTLVLVEDGATRSGDAQLLRGVHSVLVDGGVERPAVAVFSVVATATQGAVLPLMFTLLTAAWMLRHRAWVGALGVAAILAGGSVLDSLLKAVVHRARPHLIAGIQPPGGFAYPSGHATSAICGILAPALILSPLLRRHPARRALLVVALLAVFFVDLSRLVLVAHWPSDVVGGTLLGVSWSALVWAAVLEGEKHRRRAGVGPDPVP